MAKIFISYKRKDLELVSSIVKQIKTATGIDCWLDLEGIESGAQFQKVIIAAIDSADIVVCMLSQNFIAPYIDERTGETSNMYQTFPEKEVMYALGHHKRLVPISIDGTKVCDCNWLEFNCSGLNTIDWNKLEQRDRLFRDLLNWVGNPEVSVGISPNTSVQSNIDSNDSFDVSKLDSMSDSERLAYLRKWAEYGDVLVQRNLGIMCWNGNSVPQNKAEAIKWYRKAAEQGDEVAQYNLGQIYRRGDEVPQDMAEAAKWFLKSAEKGYIASQCNLGVMYSCGYGVPKDKAEAAKWYMKAAEQGEAVAQSNLGVLYANGDGVKKDMAEAVKWFRKAADQGYEPAKQYLKMIG